MSKILLICTTSNSIVKFRKSLIEALQSKGYIVYAIAFDNKYEDLIRHRGIKFYHIAGANRSVNPFDNLALTRQYSKVINIIEPDMVFTFMLKPNIFGVRGAQKAGVERIFSMVEGAGDVFINKGFKWDIIRNVVCKMYRKSFKKADKVFFLNNDDRSEFLERGLVKKDQCITIPGIGVDIEHFAYKPLKNFRTFLMIARMLKTKGVIEYCKAARSVKQKYPDTIFNYIGAEGNLKVSDIQEYIDDGSINYLGTTIDVRPFLEDCSVYVLPSYREGMPMSIMEAEAVGRSIIATDVPGCRDLVKNGINGYLVNCQNFEELADAIIRLLNDEKTMVKMSQKSREFTEKIYDQKLVNDAILKNIGVF